MAACALFLLTLLLAAAGPLAQQPAPPTRNATALVPQYLQGLPLGAVDPPLFALFPLSVAGAEAPIAIRHTLLLTVVGFNIFAAGCDPKGVALNFWGERQEIPAQVCGDFETRAEAYAYGNLRAVELEFPEAFRLYGEFMAANGYDREDRSTNMSTGVGAGNAMGMRVARFFASDGWNSQGDLTREHYRQPYEDYTGYRPVNSPWELTHPLRWQPLTQHKGNGRYAVQSHAVPFLGQVTPLVLSPEDFRGKQTPAPYVDINAATMDGRDADTVDRLVRDVFEVSANLTFEQRFQAQWWEIKINSVGFFPLFHAQRFGWTLANFEILTRWAMGEALAQHDALLLAWKEKRRHDAVRPETVVANRFRGERVRAWVNPEVGVAEISAEDWEPLVPTQAHSEYPSASAALCNATFQHGELLLPELTGPQQGPMAVFNFPPGTFAPFVDQEGKNVSLVFRTHEEASRACGQSRLWAGVHFGPSVPAGQALADGVGRAAYEHVKELVQGRVPAHCSQCT